MGVISSATLVFPKGQEMVPESRPSSSTKAQEMEEIFQYLSSQLKERGTGCVKDFLERLQKHELEYPFFYWYLPHDQQLYSSRKSLKANVEKIMNILVAFESYQWVESEVLDHIQEGYEPGQKFTDQPAAKEGKNPVESVYWMAEDKWKGTDSEKGFYITRVDYQADFGKLKDVLVSFYVYFQQNEGAPGIRQIRLRASRSTLVKIKEQTDYPSRDKDY